MDEVLQKIKDFHGHLGPYVTIGYRMGLAANKEFGDNALKTIARVFSGTVRPMSCMIDGIQLSSGCTMGKGNIIVEEMGEPRAIFSDKEGTKSIEISLRDDIHQMLKEKMISWDSGEELAGLIYPMPDEDLLIIRNL